MTLTRLFLKLAVFVAATALCLNRGAYGQTADNQTANNQTADDRVLFILDGSGSMWGQIDGTAKISVAKDVLTDLIAEWDESVPIGLMAYGHRKKGDCGDIELIARPGDLDRIALIDRVQSISPKGKTPITNSIIEAASAIESRRGNPAIVLVSDGLETCEADPCVLASTYELLNPQLEVHVVGFDVTDEEARSLQCISDRTGGKFLRADGANSLKSAISETVALARPISTDYRNAQTFYAKLCEQCDDLAALKVQWVIRNDSNETVHDGLGQIFDPQDQLAPGTYTASARYLSSALVSEGSLVVGEDGQQVGRFNLNGGAIRAYAYATDEKTLPADPIFYQYFPLEGGKAASDALGRAASSGQSVWLPAGEYRAKASHNNVEETVSLTVIAGEVTDYDFDMRVGYLQPSAALRAGGRLLAGSADYSVYRTEEDARANRGRLVFALGAQNKEIPLRAGTYWVKTTVTYNRGVQTLSRHFPVEVVANETSRPMFDMDAGLLKHVVTSGSGKGISNIDYVSVNTGRRVAYYNLGGSKTVALSAGDYQLRVLSGGNWTTSDPFTIKAGETTEIEMIVP